MKLRLKPLLSAIPYLLLAAVLLAVLFFPRGEEERTSQRVVTVWNVDTFEGGKGSRTNFLRSVAREVEKERAGVYFLVSSYTAEGARAALGEGKAPDILSFGIGLDGFLERSKPLPDGFAGGEVGGKCFAFPWCMGGYALFSLTDDFGAEGSCAISAGGCNLPAVAALYADIRGEEIESLAAYTGFLNGDFRYLLGTQRDEQRFLARGLTVYRRELPAYNDLFCYISILGEGEDCTAFYEKLLSDGVQERLGEIGMRRPTCGGGTRTPSVFSDSAARADLTARARNFENLKNMDNFLKTV